MRARGAAPLSDKPRVRPGRRIIGIFGGSFDPPTRAHLTRIRELATTYRQAVIGLNGQPTTRRLDELWVVPVFKHMSLAKRDVMTPFSDRLPMLNAGLAAYLGRATATKATVRISTIEAELGGISNTLATIEALRARHPDCDFVIYLGADLRDDLAKWRGFDRIQKLACVEFLSRGGYDNRDVSGSQVEAMASTDVRTLIAAGDLAAAARLLDPAVASYLMQRPDLLDRYVKRESKKR